MRFLAGFKGQQGAGAGSAYIASSFLLSGALTYVFQGISTRALGGPAGYAPLGLLWTATFLTVQVLWIASTQTIGRHVAEREARGEDWRPVLASVRHWQAGLLVAFVVVALLASPLLTERLFKDPWLTAAFIVAVALYAPEYFRRGIFNGHRQSFRLGAQIVAESSSRVVVAAALLVAGMGVLGPALAIVLAPLIGVLAVRPGPVAPPEREGGPFSAGRAFRFAGPVLVCMACAQALANGGPILASVLGGTRTQVGLFTAALILTRVPQYVLGPVVGALLPHASRAFSTGGQRSLDRFVGRSVGLMGLVGVLMVGGTWLFGEWAMRLFAGSRFDADRELLVVLALLAALYLLCDTLNQALFAVGRQRLAALSWLLALPISAACLAALQMGILYRISYSLALGTLAVVAAQAVFYLLARGRTSPSP